MLAVVKADSSCLGPGWFEGGYADRITVASMRDTLFIMFLLILQHSLLLAPSGR